MRQIAFFGGSFDPPHRGHLAVAKAAADCFALDGVLFAPVATQPLKNGAKATSFFHRFAMTVLATQADARFIPSLLDAPLNAGPDRPNYTVDTLERLRSSLDAETQIFTLLGADSWREIANWHDAARLLSVTDWIVAARPGFSIAGAERALPPEIESQWIQDSLELHHANGSKTRVFFLPEVQEEVSATELRAALDAGRTNPECLPAPVQDYIRKTGLYRDKAVPGGIR